MSGTKETIETPLADNADKPTGEKKAFDEFDFGAAEKKAVVDTSLSSKIPREVGVLAIIVSFCVLAALTASLPSTKPYTESEAGLAEINAGDTAWILSASALVLIMTPGLAFFYGGMVGKKNVISTIFQSFATMGLVSVLWVLIGFSLAFGDDANGSGILGDPKTFGMFKDVGADPDPNLAGTIPLVIFAMFQLMFALITPVLVAGAVAERVNFSSWLLFVFCWHLVVYCPLVHITWHPDGILRDWGYLDFAGGLVVEMASGYAALSCAHFLGPRKAHSSAANIPLIMIGCGLLWFGWLGFNAGSALASGGLACQTFATTNTCASASMMTWIFMDYLRGKMSSAIGACNGVIVGLVTITPACGFVTVGGSMCIGIITCIICYVVGAFFNETTGIDDSLDVFTIHGLGGTCGVILTAVFSSLNVNPGGADGLVYGEGITLGKHLAVVVISIPCIMITTWGCCTVANFVIPFRVTEEQEQLGLDLSMHGETVADDNKNDKSV
eukprot:CAMPEP_0182419648 /NCGR_PEP_ID=MMETSP1167-20130531/4057_1 /TAXON_ID=2988 /ORGANISM="Mallomonas Sp, Strain CCMP3275" /LENGTH=499 /DNA_ID=CAMNT_0024594679 /DNA_START=52 /DNA_END=1551 /DNA_ORIENTATION=-